MTTEDRRLIFVAVAGLVGGGVVGKIAIDSMAAARAEKLAKLPPAERSKPTKLDDIVKYFGAIFGVYIMVRDAPRIYDEAKKLLRNTP